MRQVMVLGLLALGLGGCMTTSAASIRGACDSFERPEYAVRGVSREDRRWIAGQIETGVTVCGWSRPRARAIARQAGS